MSGEWNPPETFSRSARRAPAACGGLDQRRDARLGARDDELPGAVVVGRPDALDARAELLDLLVAAGRSRRPSRPASRSPPRPSPGRARAPAPSRRRPRAPRQRPARRTRPPSGRSRSRRANPASRTAARHAIDVAVSAGWVISVCDRRSIGPSKQSSADVEADGRRRAVVGLAGGGRGARRTPRPSRPPARPGRETETRPSSRDAPFRAAARPTRSGTSPTSDRHRSRPSARDLPSSGARRSTPPRGTAESRRQRCSRSAPGSRARATGRRRDVSRHCR